LTIVFFSEEDGDTFEENDTYKCVLSLLHVGFLCSKESPKELPTMRDVVMLLESLKEYLVGNMRLRRIISNFLGSASALRNVTVSTSNDQNSTFSL